MTDDIKQTLSKDFTVTTVRKRRDTWLISCRQCWARWNLPKGKETAGNILRLLEHAASHQEDT